MHRLRARGDDAGVAIVEFVLVGTLVVFLALGVIQVALVLHARNVLAADTAEGARHAASLGVPISSGGAVAEDLARKSLPGAGRDLACSGGQSVGAGGLLLAQVTCRTTLHLTFVPFGAVRLSVTGRSIKEVVQ